MNSRKINSYSKDEMQRPITIDLIRKRSEHNSNLVSTLEEIALHQEELTSIGTTIGKVCGKTLRILLLQNNVIGTLHSFEMKYFKVLEYLNLALNNLTVVGGLDGLANEHLTKIDLTLNFVDFDTLEESMHCLASLPNLRELFMMGNPCCLNNDTDSSSSNNSGDEINGIESKGNDESPIVELMDEDDDIQEDILVDHGNLNDKRSSQRACTKNTKKGWKNFRKYVISKLSTLESLDGKIVLRSERIKAMQMKSTLEMELQELAKQCRIHKAEEQKLEALKNCLQQQENHKNDSSSYGSNENEQTKHCPQDRMKLSNEMAMQKAEKEEHEKANQPKLKGEKDFEKDQQITVEMARRREERGDIKQCNEGKWKFSFDEEQHPGHLTLDVAIQKHLSTSLVDVDVHPSYISIVIKSKVLRLILPVEVKAGESTAKRSLTTGHLLITMPKFDPKEKAFLISKNVNKNTISSTKSVLHTSSSNQLPNNGKLKQCHSERGLQETLLQEAKQHLSGSVEYRNIVQNHDSSGQGKKYKAPTSFDMVESSTRRMKKSPTFQSKTDTIKESINEEPPALF